jgi:purine nucleoside permease
MRGPGNLLPVILLCLLFPATLPAADDGPRKIRVVVAAMYELGEVRGDAPGELQFWVERLPLEESLPFPLGEGNLYLNDEGVLAILLGGGIPNATASVMALGMDPRFDLSRAYWLIAGVAGGDPADLSLGSAAWARHVVDGDLLYEIDGREIPDDWPYGLFPLGTQRPTENPADLSSGWTLDTIVFSLNEQLVDWAFAVTHDVELGDAPGIAAYRLLFEGYPQARRAPFVTIGDTLSSSTYWHGELMNLWANDWLKLYAGKGANFMTSNMEDSGTLTALHRLARLGLVDSDRVLVLRTASNYTMPPPGKSAVWSKNMPYPDSGRPALESAYSVGNMVVQALLANWAEYSERLPAAADN